jgi:hypothetical protein
VTGHTRGQVGRTRAGKRKPSSLTPSRVPPSPGLLFSFRHSCAIKSDSTAGKKPSRKKPKKEKKKEKKREREPKPRRTRGSKERSSHERAHPNPRSRSSRQPPPRAPEQRRGEQPARRRAPRAQFVPGWSPTRFPANPNCFPPPGGQLNSCCFSDSIRFRQARCRPRRRSRRYELAGIRRGRGSCLHCSRVWASNRIGLPGLAASMLDSGLPRRSLGGSVILRRLVRRQWR